MGLLLLHYQEGNFFKIFYIFVGYYFSLLKLTMVLLSNVLSDLA